MALNKNVAVLLGGVGGVKLAQGLAQALPASRLSLIVNTGDDFWHWGLRICPDLDTVMYTLAGLVDSRQGWGIADESFVAMQSMERLYGQEGWFRLGDKDLATHLTRTNLLRQGQSLTEVTRILARCLGIESNLLPMCDADMPTRVLTASHVELDFQEYFVKHRWQPVIQSLRYSNCENASLSPAVRAALEKADIVLIAPSNPWLSIAPILNVPGMRDLLQNIEAPVAAITPIIGGEAVKGPTAKIMRELGLEVSADAIVDFYTGLIDGFVDDIRNAPMTRKNLRIARMDTLMRDDSVKRELAKATLEWVGGWSA